MTAYEMMLSESQERMLLVAERGRELEVFDVFHKWGLDALEIGRVTGDGMLRVLHQGRVAAEIPAHALAQEGPRYERPIARATERTTAPALVEFAREGSDLTENFRRLLASPAIASKQWVTEQYDSMIRTNTRVGPGAGDAGVLRLKGTKRALAIKTDGNGRWGFLSPRIGAMHAVAEAARNVACTGARPIAATNCLNFGNPEKPEVMWQFTETIEGIAETCRVLETPITGGNVSFYNETLGKPIYPTPILGILGLIEDADCAMGSAFRDEGDVIVLLDSGRAASSIDAERREFSSSEYAKTIHGIVAGAPPAIDLGMEKNLVECLVELTTEKTINSAHDISDGGLAVTVAECCFESNGLSADVSFVGRGFSRDALAVQRPGASAPEELPVEVALFGERGGRAVVSVSPASLARVNAVAAKWNVRDGRIGAVTRSDFRIQYNETTVIRGSADWFRQAWSESLRKAIEGQ
jgi:phosphoribosylformylglycinamidine synthase